MSLYSEIEVITQYSLGCGFCFNDIAEADMYQDMNKKSFYSELKTAGWRIIKRKVACPDCAKRLATHPKKG